MKLRILSLLMICMLAVSCLGAAESFTYADTIAWDGEYDVVVIGYGGSGATAAFYAAKEGASVLLTEKAPQGFEGGNTKYSAQIATTAYDYDEALKYYNILQGEYDRPEEISKVWVQGLMDIRDQLANDYGATVVLGTEWAPSYRMFFSEYPEFEGSEAVDGILVSQATNNGAMFYLLQDGVDKNRDKIDVWYESPAEHLIQDPITKTILGVQIDKQGKKVNIRAKNGVVLACGGFENNPQMWQDYLYYSELAVAGTFYNTGDGVRMAQEVGADLWHMNNIETSGYFGGTTFEPLEGEHGLALTNDKYKGGSMIMVAGDGTRFVREDFATRHGNILYGGTWRIVYYPETMYLVFDQAQLDRYKEIDAIPERYLPSMISSDTIEGLAEKLGTEKLADTIELYNGFVKDGRDVQFERDPEYMVAFGEGPYYAMKMLPRIVNTQGGPRRNENAEVIDTNGNAIPHLYSCGELGGITTNLYNGGGTVAECIIFGKIAGMNAAAPKAELEPIHLQQVESNLVYTLGNDPDQVEEEKIQLAENEYVGVGNVGMGGTITVKVTLEESTIKAIEILEHNETPGISDKGINEIPAAIISAQSTQVDTISGVTMTSKAIINAVNDALAQAGL